MGRGERCEEGLIGAGGFKAADRPKCARGWIQHCLIGAAGQGAWWQPNPQFGRRRLQPPGGRRWHVLDEGLQLAPCQLVCALRDCDSRVADVKCLALKVNGAIKAGYDCEEGYHLPHWVLRPV